MTDDELFDVFERSKYSSSQEYIKAICNDNNVVVEAVKRIGYFDETTLLKLFSGMLMCSELQPSVWFEKSEDLLKLLIGIFVENRKKHQGLPILLLKACHDGDGLWLALEKGDLSERIMVMANKFLGSIGWIPSMGYRWADIDKSVLVQFGYIRAMLSPAINCFTRDSVIAFFEASELNGLIQENANYEVDVVDI